ncbi:MAG TPA: hypothetical protein VM674_06055 [Candidatus Acidoferrum sp.]|nr:hypothetical protein [Candidatus Acidoferrum sp.]
MNRMLLLGGGALALGAVVIAVVSPHFEPVRLGVNLGAIALGLLMGKGIARFLFGRISAHTGNPLTLTNRGK